MLSADGEITVLICTPHQSHLQYRTTEKSTEMEPSILQEEVAHAIMKIKPHKAPALDNLPAELLKAIGDWDIDLMWKICHEVWTTKTWLDVQMKGIFLPLPKKVDITECSNYSTISLISYVSKVLLYIIWDCMK